VLKPLIGASCSRRTAIKDNFYAIEKVLSRVVLTPENKRDKP